MFFYGFILTSSTVLMPLIFLAVLMHLLSGGGHVFKWCVLFSVLFSRSVANSPIFLGSGFFRGLGAFRVEGIG